MKRRVEGNTKNWQKKDGKVRGMKKGYVKEGLREGKGVKKGFKGLLGDRREISERRKIRVNYPNLVERNLCSARNLSYLTTVNIVLKV